MAMAMAMAMAMMTMMSLAMSLAISLAMAMAMAMAMALALAMAMAMAMALANLTNQYLGTGMKDYEYKKYEKPDNALDEHEMRMAGGIGRVTLFGGKGKLLAITAIYALSVILLAIFLVGKECKAGYDPETQRAYQELIQLERQQGRDIQQANQQQQLYYQQQQLNYINQQNQIQQQQWGNGAQLDTSIPLRGVTVDLGNTYYRGR